jgi:hypothetical protein
MDYNTDYFLIINYLVNNEKIYMLAIQSHIQILHLTNGTDLCL